MKKTTIGVLLIGLIVLAALAFSVLREKPVAVTVISLERGDIRSSVSNTRAGTINTCDRARLSPILAGQIALLPVQVGNKVEAGQILLELWNTDVRAQLQLAEKERLSSVARAEEICATSRVANREAERFDRLYDQQLISEEKADLVFGEAQAKEAACRAMRNMIGVSDANIDLAKARLEQTILRAPFAGTIAEINGEVGEIITPSPVGVTTPPAIDLIDSSCMFVTAPIDEMDAPRLQSGMRAEITLDAFPEQSFPATVRRVAPYVLAIENQARTVNIEAEFDTSSDNLMPGYSADVEVILDVRKDVMQLPTQALIDDNKVMILNGTGILEERTVETGISNWQITELISGVAPEDKIVLSIDRDGVIAGADAIVQTE